MNKIFFLILISDCLVAYSYQKTIKYCDKCKHKKTCIKSSEDTKGTHRVFPAGFKFGVSSSAYQIEGAWNVSDKGEGVWDHLVHTTNLVNDGNTGDEACDSYNKYERDVEMLLELGVDFYRFSLSWSRILPTGFDNKISEDGILYYNKLIDLLISKGITPFVTIFHFDLPKPLQDLGGWTNSLMDRYFEDYARVCLEAFGDRVKNWLTLNEPQMLCYYYDQNLYNYSNDTHLRGISSYLCGHNLLKAHARAYHLYDNEYRSVQNGRISITLNSDWHEPNNITDPIDLLASEIAMQFDLGMFAHPIFSLVGDYPDVVKKIVALKSTEQGYFTSRLPVFTPTEVDYIKGTHDFFGLNHYTSYMVGFSKNSADTSPRRSMNVDEGIFHHQLDDWVTSPADDTLSIVPWGFRNILLWIKNSYNNPEILMFEQGYPDLGGIADSDREGYLHQYINAMLDAVEMGCNVTAYSIWSLMDNFEWFQGYKTKYGLYAVDFSSTDKKTIIKCSGKFYANVAKTRTIERDKSTL